jgi:hypothetical protein
LLVHRQLDEALTQGLDPLHLASVFGLDPKTAIRYADNARALLVITAEEQDPAGSRQPKGSEPSIGPECLWVCGTAAPGRAARPKARADQLGSDAWEIT